MYIYLSVYAGEQGPLVAYDKNNIKIVFHVGKDRPRPDIVVVAVSVMSLNSASVKSFTFQAAVPKVRLPLCYVLNILFTVQCNVKSFPCLSQTRVEFTLLDHGYGRSVLHSVSFHVPASADTYCAYPRRDGLTELTWVIRYIARWLTHLQTVSHPSTNRARC